MKRRMLVLFLPIFAAMACTKQATPSPISEGVTAYQRGDYAKAMQIFLPLAIQGDPKAQTNLGVMFHNGKGVKQSYSDAMKWYRKAAEQGLSTAECNLGEMYYAGEGTSQNFTEAEKWYRKASDQGSADAENNLGTLYENGQGVERDELEASVWYRKAANQGLAIAQNNLGVMYVNGQGVARNFTEAAKWYRKAADQGLSAAQNNLGALYFNGQGVNLSVTEAISWFRKAADQGNTDARAAIASITVADTEKTSDQPAASPKITSAVTPTVSDSDIEKVIARQIASIPLRQHWRLIRTDKVSHDGLGYLDAFTLIYKDLPGSDEVEDDTKLVARSVLKRVVNLQRPSEPGSLWITVCAIQDGLHGETGKPLVRPLGCTKYTSDSDQLSFDPNSNTPPSWFR